MKLIHVWSLFNIKALMGFCCTQDIDIISQTLLSGKTDYAPSAYCRFALSYDIGQLTI